jgi:hypothetical protein
MVQYLRWMWRDAPRSLRLEFLITILVIELLALATMLVLSNPRPKVANVTVEEVSVSR